MTRRLLSLLTVVAIAVAAYAAAPRWLDIIFRQPDSVSYIVRTIRADSIASAEHIPGEATQYDTLLVTTKAGTRHGFALDSMSRCELRPHVPVIYINTDEPAYDIVDKVNYLSAKLSMSAGAGVDAEFDSLPPTTMKVRGRGNTTLNFPKKPYRLKFDKKISLCGLKKAKNYALIANYIDVTLMHNTCAFAIAERMGLPYTNHSIAVDVVFNGRYCGSYMLTEKIGINAGSVDIDEENGLLLELDDHMDEDFCYWSPGLGIPVMVKDPDLTELAEADTTLSATERFDSIKAEFNAAERSLLSSDTEAWQRHFDLPSAVRYLLMQNITGNWEFHHPRSLYIFRTSPGEKFYFGPAWDFDWTAEYFSFLGAECDYNYPLLLDTPASEMYRLMARSEAFWDAYRAEWRRFKTRIWPDVKAYMQQYADLLETSALRNGELWHADRPDRDRRYWKPTTSFRRNLQDYITWIERRMEYIDQSPSMGLYW